MSGKVIAVWICNVLVALLAAASIACYFLGDFWKVNISLTITKDMVSDMVASDSADSDAEWIQAELDDVIGEDGVTVELAFAVEAGDVIGSFTGDPAATVDALIGKNVESIVASLRGPLTEIAKGAAKTVAKTTVKDQVHKNVKDYLAQQGSDAVSDAEVAEKMETLGITDEYIGEKTDAIIESIFSEGSTVDSVTEDIMTTIDTVLSDIRTNAAEHSAEDEMYADLVDLELSEEDRAAIREDISKAVGQLSESPDGTIDADALISSLIAQALAGGENGGNTGGAREPVTLADAPMSEDAAQKEQELEEQVKASILQMLPEGTHDSLIWVFRVMAILMAISMLSWVYILIKLLVKVFSHPADPTVKLKCPIWLGWLPYLFCVGIPSIALMILPGMLQNLPAEAASLLTSLQLGVSSAGVIAAIAALVCFAISIFYMVVRKQFKREQKA